MNIKSCKNRPVLNPCTLEGRNYQVDPYIGCEHYCYYCYVLPLAECRQTRKVLELLLNKGFSVSILTKSDLVLRDTDLLASMKNARVSVSVSLFSCALF